MKAKSGSNNDESELLARYRELVAMQSSVIHALVAALGATTVVKDEDDEESAEEGEEEK